MHAYHRVHVPARQLPKSISVAQVRLLSNKEDDAHACQLPKSVSAAQARFLSNEEDDNNDTYQPLHFPSYATLLRHFGHTKNLLQGKILHTLISKRGHSQNVFLANLLVQMYGKCRAVDLALDVFDNIREKNLFSWGIIIEASNQNCMGRTSLQLFHQMKAECVIPDNITLLSIVSAHSIL
eukprot:c4957_g2_i1 orf=366-908(+)